MSSHRSRGDNWSFVNSYSSGKYLQYFSPKETLRDSKQLGKFSIILKSINKLYFRIFVCY